MKTSHPLPASLFIMVVAWLLLILIALPQPPAIQAQSATTTPTPTTCGPDTYEPDDSAAQAQPLTIDGVAQHHNFNRRGDEDWLRFEATAGRYYNIWTENLAGADTILILVDIDGQTELVQNDDDPNRGLASRIVWQAPNTGTYYVRVEEYNLLGNCVSYDIRATAIPLVYLPIYVRMYHPPVVQPTPTPTPIPTPTPTPVPSCLPTWLANIDVPDAPKGLLATGDRLYVGLYNTASLGIINSQTGAYLRTSPSPGLGANGVAISQGKIYMANRNSATLSIYTAADPQSYVASLPTGDLPFGVAANDSRVFVANFGDDSLTIIDSTLDRIVANVPVGAQPALLAATPFGVIVPLYKAGSSSGVRLIDNAGNNLGFTPTGRGPFAAAYDPTTGRVYVSHRGDRRIVVLDAQTLTVVDEFSTPGTPYALAINPISQHLFVVGAADDDVYVYAMPAKKHLTTLAMQPIDAVDGGQGISVHDNRVYVSIYGSRHISILDDSACLP